MCLSLTYERSIASLIKQKSATHIGNKKILIHSPFSDSLLPLSVLGKPAKLSTQYIEENGEYSFGADKAVDGIYTSRKFRESTTHSLSEFRPWWRVDLVDVYCVWAVNILNRSRSKW